MMAYGVAADTVDDYLRIAESTATKCLKKFNRGIIEVFGEEYLRRPTMDDIQRLLQVGEACGFPGMLGSIDCMHWQWQNFPVAWHDMFTRGNQGKPTIVASASHDLWIWHAFFGVAGSNNDINILDRSPVFREYLLHKSNLRLTTMSTTWDTILQMVSILNGQHSSRPSPRHTRLRIVCSTPRICEKRCLTSIRGASKKIRYCLLSSTFLEQR